jgi:uncharacterized RDD family membrane protein YckC
VRPLDATIDPRGPRGADAPPSLRSELAPEGIPEASASPLRSALVLDRRAGGERAPVPAPRPAPVRAPAAPRPAPAAAPPPPPLAHAGELAALERSGWELGRGGETVAAAPGDWAPDLDVDVDAVEVHVERAATWRRAAAWALDALPFALAGVALGRAFVAEGGAGGPGPAELDALLDLLARERVIVLSVAAAVTIALAVYVTVAHALAGATLGKRLLRLRVVGPDGGRPSPARSAARSALAIASAALLGLGFALALFTRSGRGLHDLLARTWVVKAP